MAAIAKRFLAKLGLDNNSNTILNVADPVNAQDAATKNYITNRMPLVTTNTSGSPLVIAVGSTNQSVQSSLTALAVALSISAPTGTPSDGQKLTIRLKDNGTARALTWTITSGGFRIIGTILPTTTVASKTTYVGCIYNAADNFWDVVSVVTQA